MQIPAQGPVVAGVDGTTAGLAAVRLAAREAGSRGRVLKVVHAFTWPDPRSGAAGADYAPARRAASRVVEEAVVTAQRSTPGVDARGQLVDGPAGRVLLRLSRHASLIVLGAGRMVITPEVAAQAWCPVLVTRTARPPSGPVVAAVDGSAYSVLALRFAAEESRRRGVAVHAVHVVLDDGQEAAGHRVLDEAIAAVAELPSVRRMVLTGSAPATLIAASRRAGLIILGPRGLTASGRLGAVASAVLRRGLCPAVFVHSARVPARRVPRSPKFHEPRLAT
ncbi:universal stress protein [Actinoplanes rectilineatus]|uniref:universal stress protein n=1 Tax=Actinoplanes rectilineatus TaxID=113571 RepID=UPI0006976F3D|nr:universal stress protein [Actinoplanes rectilineatus]